MMSTFDIIRWVVPETFIAYNNLSRLSQLTVRLLWVVTPYSSPNSPNLYNSLFVNRELGNNGSIPERVSYIFAAPYI